VGRGGGRGRRGVWGVKGTDRRPGGGGTSTTCFLSDGFTSLYMGSRGNMTVVPKLPIDVHTVCHLRAAGHSSVVATDLLGFQQDSSSILVGQAGNVPHTCH
jgi:hypothetical protein